MNFQTDTASYQVFTQQISDLHDKIMRDTAQPLENEPSNRNPHGTFENLQGIQFLTVDQVAEILQLGRNTVLRFIKEEELEALQLGGKKGAWRIHPDWLKSFLLEKKRKSQR